MTQGWVTVVGAQRGLKRIPSADTPASARAAVTSAEIPAEIPSGAAHRRLGSREASLGCQPWRHSGMAGLVWY